MEINQQIAIITGGASGMGAATAQQLAQAGARVALLDINSAAVEKLASELHGIGIQCDVTHEASVNAALTAVKNQFGTPRICINCAGIAPPQRMIGREGPMPLQNFQRVIDINLIGTFNVMRLVANEISKLEPLSTGERGVVINTASVAAYEGQIGQAAYSASKGAIVAMTLPIARELAQFGIRVMTIAPGLMHTPMLAGLPQAAMEQLAATIPFPKRLGEPQEFARLAQHIIENSYLNGSVIRLDGALRMAPK